MKVSLDWLRQYCPADLPRKSLLEKFSMIGLNVEDAAEVGGDLIIELEVTSNRGDCLSHIGVSRELSAATGVPLQLPPLEYKADRQNAADVTSVEVLDGELCPRYAALIIRDVTIAESPDWLKKRIESIGLRPVNNVVDITNFVLMECGQPLHAFDLDKLKEKRIVVRRAKKGEIIVAIDGTKCELNEEMLIIADAFRRWRSQALWEASTPKSPHRQRISCWKAPFSTRSASGAPRARSALKAIRRSVSDAASPGTGWTGHRDAPLR